MWLGGDGRWWGDSGRVEMEYVRNVERDGMKLEEEAVVGEEGTCEGNREGRDAGKTFCL